MIPASGLASPNQGSGYVDYEVQGVLQTVFPDMFPSIIKTEDGPAYQMLDENGKDLFVGSKPLAHISEMPEDIMASFVAGWMKLRQHIKTSTVGRQAQAILLNLRLPDPSTSLHRYVCYERAGKKQIAILWGFQATGKSCIAIERVLSQFSGVSISNIQRLLASTMTETSRVAMESAAVPAPENKSTKTSFNKFIKPIAAAAVLLLTVSVVLIYTTGFNVESIVTGYNQDNSDYIFEEDPDLFKDEINFKAAQID